MSDEAALLRAIHAHPDDDTPRLVFADWLDEHGQPERGTHSRADCARARSQLRRAPPRGGPHGSSGGLWRCELQLQVVDAKPNDSAEVAIEMCPDSHRHRNPRVLERDVVKLPATGDTASCVYRNDFGQYLVCAVVRDGKCVALSCEAPRARFAEFRPLFEYVARSLLVGAPAQKRAGEEKTVPASSL